ncbi:hypothetical protein V1278_002002 [Bradyrhizobium sp. AZCC 1577]|uniref:hypothetical protein n=1 Tax=Bradyrhizobium sp. AZCC 1577 TaxID=3117019 RepID=UPI002FF30E65
MNSDHPTSPFGKLLALSIKVCDVAILYSARPKMASSAEMAFCLSGWGVSGRSFANS